MILKYDKLIDSLGELKQVDRTSPFNVVGAFINILNTYDLSDDSKFMELFKYLVGEFQNVTPIMRQNIKDRMSQNNKAHFIGNSYFIGATPGNDYKPSVPFEIEITKDENTKLEDGFVRLFLKSGGADNLRPIIVRLAKDGNYYVWSDSFMGLLAVIRTPESLNPWA